MSITPILYIILGISLGVGAALIFLQEKFTKERRKLIALNEAEKVKSADLLKSLDAKWEEKSKEDKEKIAADTAAKIHELEEALALAENQTATPDGPLPDSEHSPQEIAELQASLQEKEENLAGLLADKSELTEDLQTARQEIEDLHGEISFLKEELQTVKEASKKPQEDDDFLVLGPGNHYIPGSVARNLMKRKK